MLSAQKQRQRDRSRSSQRSSFDLPSSRPLHVPEPAAGTKRLFSNRQSGFRIQGEDQGHGENDDPEEVHSEKRRRSGNWPLPSSPANSSVARQPLQSRNAPNSPGFRRPNPQKRPSKFVEGSMNDRVSNKPHNSYLGLEEDSLLNNESWEQATKPRPHSCLPHSNVSSTGLSESSRHSSIFRFGKSLAATFNPSNWKLFNKPDRAANEVEIEDPQHRVLRERQAKAEKIYAELKQTGHFPNLRAQSVEAFSAPRSPGKHDSGVSFNEKPLDSRTSIDSTHSMTKEEKRKGRVFLEPPSSVPIQQRGVSPAISGISTPSRNSFQHLKKTSLSNLKKKFSIDRLNESNVDLSRPEHSARRIPSRKEFEKQQRLVKKVSDLEGKLEAARRQLNESLAEPLPPRDNYSRGGKRKFVPGAMPTLPSERLLSAYVQQANDEEEVEIGKAVSHDLDLARQARNEERGRSKTVREPEMSPSHFYPQASPPSKEAVAERDRPLQSIENVTTYLNNLADETKSAEDATNVADRPISAEFSKTHADHVSKDQSLTSLSSGVGSEKDSELHEQQRKHVSAVTTENGPPKRKAISSNKLKARKRKSFDDGNGSYRPSALSNSEEGSEIVPAKRQTLKRKNVRGSQQNTSNVAEQMRPPPPTRLPPPRPDSPTQGYYAAELREEPASKSVKTAVSTSPSSAARAAPRPSRTISRKAVASKVPSNTSKITKPHPRARQSASPPPTATTFEPSIDYVKPSRNMSLKQDEPQEIENEDVAVRSIAPSKRSSLDNTIPPLPKLPKTVRLPGGEVVDVKVKNPSFAPVATSSRTRSRSRGGSVVSTSRVPKLDDKETMPKLSNIPKLSADGRDEEAMEGSGVSRSNTKTSFEWPADCF